MPSPLRWLKWLSTRERPSYQNGLTVVTPISAGKQDELRRILRKIDDEVEDNDLVPFLRCERIHFARWVILKGSRDARDRHTPAVLVFSTNYDEPLQAHLAELYDRAQPGLDAVYACCEGYPRPEHRTRETVLGYLRAHDIGRGTLYVGTRGLTVPQIRREAELRDAIEEFLDGKVAERGFMNLEPAAIRQAIRNFVASREDLRWALRPPPSPRRVWPRRTDMWIIAGALLFLGLPILVGYVASPRAGLKAFGGLLALVVAGLATGAVVLRYRERTDPQDPATTDFEHVASLLDREDVRSGGRPIVQNQMSSVTNLKPGRFRRFLLRAVLLLIDVLGRYKFTRGKLGTIPTIHFARWVLLDGGRRLLFMSNFDGSWENYLGDFIDRAALGLTAVWSNTDGFPRSRWLVLDGATDEQRFKAYARNSQTVTEVWYSAYKHLTVENIHNNAHIRTGLVGSQSADETRDWLLRF